MKERLQKFLSAAGVASRRAAENLIREGRVEINGAAVARLGTLVDAAVDVVRVDGRRVRPQASRVYVLLNKPRGYVTTLRDPEGRPTVADLLTGLRERVYPVGRLDFQSEGLLVLTNDGPLAAALMHPRHGVEKVYLAKVRGTPSPESLDRLARGIVLDGRPTLPARLRIVRRADNAWVEVALREGRNQQVRRMLQAVGHPVAKLRRVAYGGVRIGRLALGEWRPLRPAEIEVLRRSAPVARRANPG